MRSSSGDILQNEYRLRINRVIDYIHSHYGEDLNLDMLASIAYLSKFHFHRIFQALVRETLSDFIRRVRIDRAIYMLTLELHKSITEIAMECGFSSSQNFAKVFKTFFRVSPSQFRAELHGRKFVNAKIKNIKEQDQEGAILSKGFLYDYYQKKYQSPSDEIFDQRTIIPAEILDIPDLYVTYIRYIGIIKKDLVAPAYKQLLQWAEPRGFITEGTKIIGVYKSHDYITPEDKQILDACITVPESVKADKWVNVQTIQGGLYAVHHCEVESNPSGHKKAWADLILNWLIPSAYQVDNRPRFHIYCADPEEHPLKHDILDLYLPIKPLYE